VNQTATHIAQQARGRALLFGLPVDESINIAIAQQSENMSILQGEMLRQPASENLTGLGPLQALMDDPSVEEVWINRPGEIWFANRDGHRVLKVEFSASEIENVVERLLRASGRRIDRSNPFVDASLVDGSRLHVVIPSVTKAHWSLNIRKFRADSPTLEWATRVGMVSQAQAEQLKRAVDLGKTILVSGATQAGKTTILTALINSLRAEQRLVTIEDTFEINSKIEDVVSMQTREAGPDGSPAIDMRRLVRESLRMRPSRIALGEVRGAEALDLLLAFNSGIPGFCTIHANSASQAREKLASLALLSSSGLSPQHSKQMVASAIDLVVHCVKNDVRQVTEILAVGNAGQ